MGSCPAGIVAFSFPALFGFGDGSGGVTEFFKRSLSPLGEFQLLFLQVAIHLPNHLGGVGVPGGRQRFQRGQ